jgi:hypothetical protein
MKHADDLDMAEQNRDMEINAILNSRTKYTSGLKHDGLCHWCEHDVEPPKLFCDSKCSLKWSRENE